jgi:3-deoxy-D-manno-octulosonic-acid transferase
MQDKIERLLFSNEYIQMFDGITVQAESVKKLLVEKGADKDKISVTGNMKFDALYNSEVYTSNNVSEFLIKKLSETKHVVVAGCLINEFEYEQVAKAFSEVLTIFPDALCVFAPRHPEKQDQLDFIEKILNENNLTYDFKSKIERPEGFNKELLILDTLGELKRFYSIGSVCYVGRDHNVLEPLFLNKKVIVPDGWNQQYPSYPVFDIVNKKGLVTIYKENELGNDLITIMQSDTGNVDIKESLKVLSGATERNERFFKSIDSKVGS